MAQVKDIMTTNVVTIKASSMVSEAIGLMKENRVHALIVQPTGAEKGYGIITEADIAYKVIARAYDPKAYNVGDVMTKPCISVKPDMSIENVARLFQNNSIHRAPVIDSELLGVVSVSDILRKGQWW